MSSSACVFVSVLPTNPHGGRQIPVAFLRRQDGDHASAGSDVKRAVIMASYDPLTFCSSIHLVDTLEETLPATFERLTFAEVDATLDFAYHIELSVNRIRLIAYRRDPNSGFNQNEAWQAWPQATMLKATWNRAQNCTEYIVRDHIDPQEFAVDDEAVTAQLLEDFACCAEPTET